jgi:hypothetical protein
MRTEQELDYERTRTAETAEELDYDRTRTT